MKFYTKKLSLHRAFHVLVLFLLFFAHSPAEVKSQDWVYIVEAGDTLWSLSKKHLKSMRYWRKLVDLNDVSDPYNLQPGTTLRFPVSWLKSGSSVATILELTGEVTVTHGKTGQTVQAQRAMLLWDRDTVTTGADSNVTLQFADGSIVLVQSLSEMKLEELTSYGDTGMAKTKLRLESGRTHNNVIPRTGPGSRFEISTPSAIAAARGTEYRISSDYKKESRTEVLTGAVGVNSYGGETEVNKGFGLVSYSDRKSLAPVRLLPAPDLSDIPKIMYRVPFPFTLKEIEGAEQYRVQIAEDSSFSTLLFDATFPGTRIWGPDLPDASYYLRINGIDRNGLEGEYAIRSFSIQAHPVPPVQIKPQAGSEVEQPALVFQWTVPPNASRYHFQLSDEAGFTKTLVVNRSDITAPTFTLDPSLKPGIYHWRVATIDQNGKIGPFSDTQQFRKTPPKPDLALAKMDSDELVFRWRKALPHQSFKCQISRDQDFTTLLVDDEVNEPSFNLQQFEPGSYYIRIAIIDSDGFIGPFGAPQTVAIPSPPPHPLGIILPSMFMALILL